MKKRKFTIIPYKADFNTIRCYVWQNWRELKFGSWDYMYDANGQTVIATF